MLAVLALASTSMARADVFRAVWGFSFAEATHGESLAITLHRARERLVGVATIEHDDRRFHLVNTHDVVVPDPRCTPDADGRVLQHIAKHRKVAARDVSRALGMSLRAAQDALKSLVDAGVCERHRQGRAIVYGVEDTTFREPTVLG